MYSQTNNWRLYYITHLERVKRVYVCVYSRSLQCLIDDKTIFNICLTEEIFINNYLNNYLWIK